MPALIAPTPQDTSHPCPVSAEQFVQILSVAARTVMLSLPSDQSSMGLTPAVVTPRDMTSTPSPPPLLLNELPVPMDDQTEPDAVPVSTDCVTVDSSHLSTSLKPKRASSGMRLNKFVRRLHDMLQSEHKSRIVEWRRGLLVLHSTDAFAKTILPKYFNTRNFKTFRRQLNYYGFVHVRSFSTTGSTTTALWVNRDLAKAGTASISSVLMLKRVEPCESAKTAEGRRVRKELAVSTVEDDIGVSAKSLQLDQIRSLAFPPEDIMPRIPMMVHCHAAPILPRETSDNESAANLLLMLSKSAVC